MQIDSLTTEDIKIIAETFRNVILALGAIVGGIWTLKKYFLLNEKKISKLQIEKIEKELKIQPVINIEIIGPLLIKNKTYKVIVNLKNDGDDDAYLKFSLPPLSVSELIMHNEDAKYINTLRFDIEIPGKKKNKIINNTILRKGMSKEYNFIIKFENSGHYFIHFEVPVDIKNKLNYEDYEKPKWTKSEIVFINIDN